MVLGGFKKSGESGARSDVRTFGVPENTPKKSEKFKLSEEDLEYIFDHCGEENRIHSIKIMGYLSYLLSSGERNEIQKRVLATEENLSKFVDKNFFLGMAYAFKLLNPEIDIAKVLEDKKISQSSIYLMSVQEQLRNNQPRNALLSLAKFRFIFHDSNIALESQWWGIGLTALRETEKYKDWSTYILIAGALRTLFPERVAELDYNKNWSQLLGALEKLKADIQKESSPTVEEIKQYCELAFNLTILDTDEVVINATGLHLINHAEPENLEVAVPEQPETLNIN